MVGNLTSRWKKHALFVQAAARVDRSLPIEWRFYGHDPSQGGIVKGDSYMDDLHAQIARAGLTDRFTWPGFFSDPVEIMSQIDLLVHSADSESFGAWWSKRWRPGCRWSAFAGGGVAEIVRHGETGLLATPDDPQELAARIEELVRDPERRRAMGQAGRRRAESHLFAHRLRGRRAAHL